MIDVVKHFFGVKARKRERVREGRTWRAVEGVKRVVVDGVPYIVKEVLSVTPQEVVVVDLEGSIKTIKRNESSNPPLGYKVVER